MFSRRIKLPNYRIIVLFILGWSIGIIFLWKIQEPNFLKSHPYFLYNLSEQEPVDQDQTCVIPRFHPFDSSVISLIDTPRPRIYCKKHQQDLTYVTLDGVLKKNTSYECFYQEVIRINDDSSGLAEEKKIPSGGIQLTTDFIAVHCTNVLKVPIYRNIHAHPRFVPSPPKSCSNCSHYNVLIFGLDSLSRLGTIRHLPLTYKYITSNLSAKVFRGFTKIGDNTYPNLNAMLTGHYIYDKLLASLNFDDWPLIWKNYSSAGYLNYFAEDFPKYGLYNFRGPPLEKPPTDYYFRPYWLAVESSFLHRMSSHMCFGNVPRHVIQLQYLKHFLLRYKDKPYFAFSFLAELTHEYLSLVTAADEDIVEFFRFLKNEDFLETTLVLFMSDHGPRFGPWRRSKLGPFEERMPLMSMIVPNKLAAQQPHIVTSLQANLGRLTSHYDSFATLQDLLLLATIPGHTLGFHTYQHGISLFGSIEKNRTCSSAGIPQHFCTCDEEVDLNVDDVLVKSSVLRVLESINVLLGDNNLLTAKCATLKLSKTLKAFKTVGSKVQNFKLKIRVVFETSPGEGQFESTVIDDVVMEDISRINSYNHQYGCVKHEVLRKFCVCQ